MDLGDCMKSLRKTLKNAASMGLSAALVMSFCVVAPGAAVATDGDAATANAYAPEDAANTAVDSITAGDTSQSLVEQSDYTNQYFKELLAAGQLSAGDGISLQTSDQYDGVLVSGSAADLANKGITVSKTLNFDQGVVSRIRVQALAARKTKASLACYVDGSSEPLASFKLRSQSKSGSWDMGARDYCLDISSLNLTGEHTVSFRIVDTNAEQPQVLLKSFEFMEFSVPVINFNIDESMGTIDAMNASVDHSVECYGSMDINVPQNYVSEYTGEQMQGGSYELDYIRGRGNSTWGSDVAHKPYKVKLDKKAGLLGMGKNKHWVLLANYYDNSQLRNKITYWLSEQLGMEYTVKLEPVEVVMNGEYYGSYFLCEQVRIGKNRIDIDDLEETPDATDADTISGGYLVNMEYTDDPKHSFITHHGESNPVGNWTIESPKFDSYFNEAQYKYISDYFNKVDEAIYSSSFTNSAGERYTDLLDLQSAVDYLWLQEFSKNGDAYGSGSTYLYKKRNGKLYYGPAWDFDYVAWGSTEYGNLHTSYWSQDTQIWIGRMLEDKVFADAFIARWQKLQSLLSQLASTGGMLDQYAARISKMVNYNVEKYGMSKLWEDDDYEDDYINPDERVSEEQGEIVAPLTFKQEVERLRSWINQRSTWVDAHVNLLSPVTCKITYKNEKGKTLGTQLACAGKNLYEEITLPKKKGYEFAGWKTSYHISYKRYLKINGYTEEEAIKKLGKSKVAKLKKNGYSFSGVVAANDLLVPCNVTLTATFKKPGASYVGKRVTKNNVIYMVTGNSAKAGYTVKVLGLKKTSVSSVKIPKTIKIKKRTYTVTELGAKAFKGCGKLKNVQIKGASVYVRNATFSALAKKAVVTVAGSALSYYKGKISCRTVRAA